MDELEASGSCQKLTVRVVAERVEDGALAAGVLATGTLTTRGATGTGGSSAACFAGGSV